MELPRYKSHKVVEAMQIVDITLHKDGSGAELRMVKGDGHDAIGALVTVNRAYLVKHNPLVGGYYVRYPDGYESWSPAESFEGGYTSVDGYPQPDSATVLSTGQPKIIGYRNLDEASVRLMNEVKGYEYTCRQLFDSVNKHLQEQLIAALNNQDITAREEEERRIDLAQPQRWAAMARTDFQVAFMKLTRAIAQPNSAL